MGSKLFAYSFVPPYHESALKEPICHERNSQHEDNQLGLPWGTIQGGAYPMNGAIFSLKFKYLGLHYTFSPLADPLCPLNALSTDL